ncbi:MAG: hypothetical protein IJV08_05150 [Bacteroidaceae bacterium]|nr:hypothetical protein [Bacteroidaceae bacterium]
MRHIQLHKYMPPSLRGRGRGRVFRWVFCLLLCLSVTSCGFFDLDEVGAETAAKMTLEQDTLYVMQGDTFSIRPVFDPDTVNITDLYFLPVNNEVLAVRGVDMLEAVGEGATKVYITSVSARLIDSCMVYVSAPWDIRLRVWPYETVFYTHITVNGQPLTEDMEVAAFVGNECRALGQAMTSQGISYIRFRVGSDILYDNQPDIDDGLGGEEEDAKEGTDDNLPRISFRCYDHRHRKLYTTPVHGTFDGEAHGTLSELFEIAF